MFGGPWDSTLIMMGVPSFYISFKFWKVVHPSVKGFEQALAVKQVSLVIFVSQPFVSIGIFDLFSGLVFKDDSDLTDCEQPLEDGSWSVSAVLLPKMFLRLLCSDILAAVYF